MTDDALWSASPRRSADYGTAARHASSVDARPAHGRHSFSEPDLDPVPEYRGARRFAEPEPHESFHSDRSAVEETGLRHQAPPLEARREPTRSRFHPRSEPVSDFWATAEARSRATISLQPDSPKHQADHEVSSPYSPTSPAPLEQDEVERDENEQARFPGQTSGSRPSMGLRHILMLVLAGVLVIALGITAWSWAARGSWLSASLWPFGNASTSPEVSSTPTSNPSASPDPESTEGARPADNEQVVDDAKFNVPSGWSLYGEDLQPPEPGRKLVRLLHTGTGVRLQVTSMTPQSNLGDLGTACEQVSKNQQELFKDVTVTPTIAVGVNQTRGAGFTCGFHGTRNEDGLPTTVTFTFLLRASDSHILSLRSMVPDSVDVGAAARQEMAAMNCTASLSFGISLPVC